MNVPISNIAAEAKIRLTPFQKKLLADPFVRDAGPKAVAAISSLFRNPKISLSVRERNTSALSTVCKWARAQAETTGRKLNLATLNFSDYESIASSGGKARGRQIAYGMRAILNHQDLWKKLGLKNNPVPMERTAARDTSLPVFFTRNGPIVEQCLLDFLENKCPNWREAVGNGKIDYIYWIPELGAMRSFARWAEREGMELYDLTPSVGMDYLSSLEAGQTARARCLLYPVFEALRKTFEDEGKLQENPFPPLSDSKSQKTARNFFLLAEKSGEKVLEAAHDFINSVQNPELAKWALDSLAVWALFIENFQSISEITPQHLRHYRLEIVGSDSQSKKDRLMSSENVIRFLKFLAERGLLRGASDFRFGQGIIDIKNKWYTAPSLIKTIMASIRETANVTRDSYIKIKQFSDINPRELSHENKFMLAQIILATTRIFLISNNYAQEQLMPEYLWDKAIEFKIAVRQRGTYYLRDDFILELMKPGNEWTRWAQTFYNQHNLKTRTCHAPPLQPFRPFQFKAAQDCHPS